MWLACTQRASESHLKYNLKVKQKEEQTFFATPSKNGGETNILKDRK